MVLSLFCFIHKLFSTSLAYLVILKDISICFLYKITSALEYEYLYLNNILQTQHTHVHIDLGASHLLTCPVILNLRYASTVLNLSYCFIPFVSMIFTPLEMHPIFNVMLW